MLIQFWGRVTSAPFFMWKRFLFPLAVAWAAVAATGAADTKKTTAPVAGKSSKRIPVHTSNRTPASSHPSSAAASRQSLSKAPRQASPSTDRYREIQESLISKGYLHGEPTGVWDQSSMDAMKKFQEDQKIDATGKITSKALISLGLGPRDESVTAPTK
jgi:Putative peptidoglycan binding domain